MHAAMVLQQLARRRTGWLLATALAGAAAPVSYAVMTRWVAPWAPGRALGPVFGTLAAFFVFAGTLYPLHRRLIGWPLTSAEHWRRFHIFGGLLACVFAAVHVGFRWPGGSPRSSIAL